MAIEINIEIEKTEDTYSGRENFTYWTTITLGEHAYDHYTVTARKTKSGEYKITEHLSEKDILSDKNKPLIINNKEGAENALYQMASDNAKLKLKTLSAPKIKDLTKKLNKQEPAS